MLGRRGRAEPETAQGHHLGPARPHAARGPDRQGLRPCVPGRTGVRQARAAHSADVPDADPARPSRGGQGFQFVALLDAAHRHLEGPIVLVWDNDRRHLSRVTRAMIEARPWLTVFQLPSYAPELNPAEGGMVGAQAGPGQPRPAWHRRTRRDRRHQAQTDAVPVQPAGRLHRSDRLHPRTAITSALQPQGHADAACH